MFKEDLTKGKTIEKILASKLVMRDKVTHLAYAPEWQFKEWDIKVWYKQWDKEFEKTFEVKDDIKSTETGNIWFEIRCYGKPSGIYASKADYIVYHIDNKFYYADRWNLLYKLNNVDKKYLSWWDYNKSELIIVNKKDLPTLFRELS